MAKLVRRNKRGSWGVARALAAALGSQLLGKPEEGLVAAILRAKLRGTRRSLEEPEHRPQSQAKAEACF